MTWELQLRYGKMLLDEEGDIDLKWWHLGPRRFPGLD